ncbi:MAG: DNA polymerase III subunit alpha, partial [Deltaproteobacteria bacterium]|nr:DNA polymerase III subunit alpha [Deltaproteobacteria bacterium]
EFKRPWGEILCAAAHLEDHLNHLSVHCGGVVIVPDEIRRYCPVEISASGVQVLQWEKDSVEDGGLVKIDLLGNRSLAVIRDALELVARNYGRRIDYGEWNPVNDPRTVETFYRGDTVGVFYFESPATRQVLKKLQSVFTLGEYLRQDHFHLNVVVTSIIRPASNDNIHTWISRLKGQPWDYPHPLLEPVLKETLGVMVFQEQLSQAAIHLAGFDAAEADTLRKVVSKKDREKRLRDFYSRFARGARERGVAPRVIEEVWRMIMGFDGYSFCKPHSASYTLVAYKSAYLRAHYPAEFMASVISNGGGFYSTFGYLSEAKRMGLQVLPPDINRSEIKYTGRDKYIRVGLMQLKDMSCEAREAIIHEREKRGAFKSLEEFLSRTASHIRLQDVRVLIKAGCFDGIASGVSRSALVWQALGFFSKKEGPKTFDLFSASHGNVSAKSHAPYPRKLMLRNEMETLGFLLSIHPLDRYKGRLRGLKYVKASELASHVGERVTTIGWMVTGKTVHTKEGDPMRFVSFEDTTGLYETVFFPGAYHRFCHMLSGSRPYVLKGQVQEEFGAITLTVHWIGFLDRYETFEKPTLGTATLLPHPKT